MTITNGTTGASKPAWQSIRSELASLIALQSNWNGEGASPARPGLVDASLRYLSQIEHDTAPADDAYLAPDGTVILEWHHPEGGVSIANIRAIDHVELTHRTPGQEPRFESAPIPANTAPVATNGVAHSSRVIAG